MLLSIVWSTEAIAAAFHNRLTKSESYIFGSFNTNIFKMFTKIPQNLILVLLDIHAEHLNKPA